MHFQVNDCFQISDGYYRPVTSAGPFYTALVRDPDTPRD